jgi:FAD/FMN-containing dehydrogenase
VRKHGLTIDSLLSAEVVMADGRVLHASETENPDLFWGIRGGGGNFGIITAFEFRAHPVDMIVGGAIFYDAADGEAVLRRYAEYARSAPEELSTIVFIMHAPPLPFIPPEKVGSLVIAVAVTYAGDLGAGMRVVAPLRALGTVVADVAGPMPYPAIYTLTAEAAAKGKYEEVRSTFAHELSGDIIDAVMRQVRSMSSPFGIVQLRVLGGAMARVPSDAMAFSHRHAGAMITAINMWTDARESPGHIAWTQGFYREMAPYSSGVYVNFLSDEGEGRIVEAYGERTYERLIDLKNRYDPTNFFHLNQNVKPDPAVRYGEEAA